MSSALCAIDPLADFDVKKEDSVPRPTIFVDESSDVEALAYVARMYVAYVASNAHPLVGVHAGAHVVERSRSVVSSSEERICKQSPFEKLSSQNPCTCPS